MMGTVSMTCSHSIFPQQGNPACWWLERLSPLWTDGGRFTGYGGVRQSGNGMKERISLTGQPYSARMKPEPNQERRPLRARRRHKMFLRNWFPPKMLEARGSMLSMVRSMLLGTDPRGLAVAAGWGVTGGQVSGKTLANGITAYLGIPFAAPICRSAASPATRTWCIRIR